MRVFTNILASSWQHAAVAWLVVCLLGIAAGLWPEAIVFPKTPRRMTPLPTLSALAAAQVVFLLLIYPLIMLRRATKHAGVAERTTTPSFYNFCPGLATAELAALVVAATPFYVVAAYFADGGASDVFRTALCVGAFIPLSVGLCGWCLPARSPATRCTALILGLSVAACLPAGVYLAHEFLRPAWADWLWQAAPVTLAWASVNPHAANHALLPPETTALTVWVLLGLITLIAAWATEKDC